LWADFSIFPDSVELSYGGYVAMPALLIFFVSAFIKAFRVIRHRNKDTA